MNQFSHYAFQEALHTVLSADTALQNSVTGIYDFVPAGTDLPYITFGNCQATDISGVATARTRLNAALYCYSRAPGRKEAGAILARMKEVLENSTSLSPLLTAAGFHLLGLRHTGSEIVPLGGNNRLYRGELRLAAFLEQLQ
jgi:hypothetical protein